MITKEQLQVMSDFEVNKALAVAMGRYVGEVGEWMPNGVKVKDESGFFYSEMNYCNTPNDIMPLAFEHKLEIDWFADGRCLVGAGDFMYQSPNPLRAIACCLILVLQEIK